MLLLRHLPREMPSQTERMRCKGAAVQKSSGLQRTPTFKEDEGDKGYSLAIILLCHWLQQPRRFKFLVGKEERTKDASGDGWPVR